MTSISISPNISAIEQARYYFSTEFLTQYCQSYYYTVCTYNNHWVEVHYGRTNELNMEASSHSREHAINFIKSDHKLKEVIKLLGYDDIKLSFRNLGTAKKSRILQTSDDAIALSVEMRNSKLWGDNIAYEVIAALPGEQRLISVASSTIRGVPMKEENDEEVPSFVGTSDINTTGLALRLKKVKLPPFVSKGRITSEGNITLVPDEDSSRIWKQDFLLRTSAHADKISSSLRIDNEELNFDHLLLLSHPTEHGKMILGQYYLTPIRVDDYDYERGKEISQRVVRQQETGSAANFYVSSKLGRRIEKTFERTGEAYLIALIKQYFGQTTKRLVDYIIISKLDYLEATKKAKKNEQENGVKYISIKKLLQVDDSDLLTTYGGLVRGARVQHRIVKKWGIGTILGFKYLDKTRVVILIEFQYAGIKEILYGDYVELINGDMRRSVV